MKACPDCRKSHWPFIVMVFFLGGFGAYLTWLTLLYSEIGTELRILVCIAVFAAVSGTGLHYVLGCISRHCRHERREGDTGNEAGPHGHGATH